MRSRIRISIFPTRPNWVLISLRTRSSGAEFIAHGASPALVLPTKSEALRRALATTVVVPVTPLHADGSPDWDTYATIPTC